MKTQKTKATKRQSVRQTVRSATPSRKSAAASAPTKRGMRRTYPVHKRLMLHPLSMFVFLCVGVYMTGMTYRVMADTVISSTVQAPPLHVPALIEYPETGDVITESPLDVTGSCPDNSYVKLRINGYYSGVAWCVDQTFTITASLFAGSNRLVVQDFNKTDLPGPAGNNRTITYTPPEGVVTRVAPPRPNAITPSTPPQTTISGTSGSAGATSNPMVIQSDFQFNTFSTEKPFSWPMTLTGGTPPYSVAIDWGDGSSTNLPPSSGTDISLEHHFKTDGYYAVVVTSTDDDGQQQTMQLAALITKKDGTAAFLSSSPHGPPPGTGRQLGIEGGALVNWLLVAWPSYAIVILMTVSFWLGEKREFALVSVQHAKKTNRRTSRS